ncbi:MAG: cysteine desulfurase family protein [Acidimicrobiia bacterium]
MGTLYLDHAATTPVRPQARAAMEPFLGESFGNPSGIHSVSQRAKNALEEAREQAASLIGAAHPLEIVFTGGGSEADNLAVKGAALVGGERRGVVTTAVEHEAVIASAEFVRSLGCEVTVVGVDGTGKADPSAIADAVGPTTGVVSVMAANNETGITQPLLKIADEVRSKSGDVVIHTDAVQAFVSEEVAVSGVDMLSLAAHKFGGPQGVGLLYVANGVKLEPAVHGGGQELGRRSGTHNVAGIVGMVAAMTAAVADREDFRRRVGAIRNEFEEALAEGLPDVRFTSPQEDRLVQHSHFRIPGVDAETLLIRLDAGGVAAAAGSACHSGALEVSHVLSAMGMSDEAASESVRISFGWTNRPEDAAAAAAAIVTAR